MIFMARPLGEIVIYVDNACAIENMAGGHKRLGHLWRKTKFKERWEGKPHAAPFIGNRRPAQTTAHLAGKNPFIDGLFTVVEFQAVQPPGDPDVMLVKDGCPLHWGTVQALACLAMAGH